MLIDMPSCSFTNCKQNHDHNCFAKGERHTRCEYRVVEKAFRLACEDISINRDLDLYDTMTSYEIKAIDLEAQNV